MSDTLLHAVLIEDDEPIRRFVKAALQEEGFQVHEADSLRSGTVAAGTRKPDLLVLDLGLPDGDGLTLLRDLRLWSQVPVIVLSARADEGDKIEALDAGADDYLAKPFGMGELLARVRAHMRRHRGHGAESSVFQFGEVQIDHVARRVTRAGVEVHLTPIEYRLLGVLARHAGRVLTQQQLLKEVWGPGHADRSHYLRVYMGHLRNKLEADPSRPLHLLTEVGVGYRLVMQR